MGLLLPQIAVLCASATALQVMQIAALGAGATALQLPRRNFLGATAAMQLAAPLLMLKQKADFKPEQLAANGAFVAGLGALAVKAYKDSK